MKDIFMYCDLATLVVMAMLLVKLGKHPAALMLYAMNPIPLVGFAGEGHRDSLMLLFLMLAFLLFYSKRWITCFSFLGLAIGVKFTAILFLPFFIIRKNIYYVGIFALAIGLPFFAFDATLGDMFVSLQRFASELRFNDSIHGLIFSLTGQKMAGVIVMLLLLMISAFVWLTQDSILRASFIVGFSFLLLAPTVHYWYLCLMLPFLVFVPSVPAMLWTLTTVFYFNVIWRVDNGFRNINSI